MRKQLLENLLDCLEDYRNPDLTRQMESYMKDNFAFAGINSPTRKRLVKDIFKDKKWSRESLLEFAELCWEAEWRELQYIAIDLLTKNRKIMILEDIAFIEKLIISKSWWDTVDGLAVNIMGYLLRLDMETRMKYLESWCNSNNIWLKRTAVLHQLKYKKEVDIEILVYTIDCAKGTREFFLNKAIGWMLREYSKTNPAYVEAFVEDSDLSALSKKEALKHLSRV